MSLALQKANDFISDFERQYRWYVEEAELGIAGAYQDALHETLELLAAFLGLGRERRFRYRKEEIVL
ncbi:MAG: type II toxin-antitoxin system RelE/ParE family toxin [Verrucomicrobia bacterium]|nr:type II toxin-antitoxin system RelE/ParE family toxin [Verrucomicrobiota bacterium]